MKRILLLTAGTLSLALGILGIFLPILPTTPFLLLAAACYLNSSQKLYNWLINHRILGLYIRSYLLYKAISVKAKFISVLTLWAVIGSTVIFFVDLLWLRILLVCIAAGVTFYILSFTTLTEDMLDSALRKKSLESARDI